MNPLFKIFRRIEFFTEEEEGFEPNKQSFYASGEGSAKRKERSTLLYLARFLAKGNYMSCTTLGCVQSLATCDGQSIFSYCHCKPDTTATFSNMDNRKRMPCQSALQEAISFLGKGKATHIITSGFEVIKESADQMAREFNLEHIEIPELTRSENGAYSREDSLCWFVANLQDSRAHFRMIGDEVEAAILSPWWIWGSFPDRIEEPKREADGKYKESKAALFFVFFMFIPHAIMIIVSAVLRRKEDTLCKIITSLILILPIIGFLFLLF